MAENKVSVELTLEQTEALRTLQNLGKQFDNFGKKAEDATKKAGSAFGTFGQTVAGVFTGGALLKAADAFIGSIAKIPGAIADVVEAGIEAETTTIRLANALAISGDASEETLSRFDALSEEIARLVGVEGEAVKQSATFALSLGATSEQTEKILKAAADVSVALGQDFNTTVAQLSITLEGSSGRLGKIDSRLKDLGETALKEGAAIDLLAQKFQGFAALNANNLDVAIRNLSVGFGDLSEAVGGAIQASPALRALIATIGESINSLTSFIQENKGEISAFTDALVLSFLDAAKASASFIDAFARVGAQIKNIFEVGFGVVAAGVNAVLAGIEQLVNALGSLVGLTPQLETFTNLFGESLKSVDQDLKDLEATASDAAYVPGTQQVFDFANAVETNMARATAAELNAENKRKEIAANSKSSRDTEIAERLAQEQAFQASLLAIQANAQIARQEADLAVAEIENGKNADTIARQFELEQQKLDAQYQADLARINLIQDSNKREQEIQTLNHKRLLANEQNAAKQRVAQAQFEKQQKDAIYQSNLQATQNFIQAGLVLAKEGSNAQRALQITQAVVNTYAAANQALAAVPFPANIPAVASVIALGIANVAKIAGARFEQGGIVGGNSFSGDRVPVRVNSGEMILNRQQQAQLFDMANGEGGGGNVISAINQLGDRIERMRISLEVNGREIARVVRDEREAGFAV
jgi:hypothetical protein